MRVVQAVLNYIGHCPSAARRDPMIHHAADRLHISPLALSQDLKRLQRKQRPARSPAGQTPPGASAPKSYPRQETALLELLVHHYNEVQPVVHDFLPPDLLTDPACRKLVELLMLDPPSTLTEGFHDFDEDTQKFISRIQIEESRAIDAETLPLELAQRYILLFWKRHLEREQAELVNRTELSNEERFKETTRLRHDIHALSKGWENARPMLETRLHTDVDF